MSQPKVLVIPNGAICSWGFTTIEVSNMQPRRNGYFAEISIYEEDNLIHASMCSLMDAQKTQTIARKMRGLNKERAWDHYMEIAVLTAIDAFQRQNPIKDIAELATHDQQFSWVCQPFLASHRPTILFGKGASGKSYFALFLACLIQNGLEIEPWIKVPKALNVLYLDYESDEDDIGHRAKGIQEAYPEFVEMPKYRKCEQPLINETGFLTKVVKQESINVLIIDSLAPACGTDLLSPDAPMTFFRTLRVFGCHALVLAHPPKNVPDGEEDTVYGNAFFQNLARSIWFFKRAPQKEHLVGLFHKKSNYGFSPHQAWTFNFGYSPWSVKFETASVEDTELEKELSLADRVILRLKKWQSATAVALAKDMSLKRGHDAVLTKMMTKDSRFDSKRLPGDTGDIEWFLA